MSAIRGRLVQNEAKSLKNWLLLLFVFLVISFNQEDEIATLDVSNIRLTDIGQITYNFSFDATIVGDSICECTIKDS